MGEEGSGGGRRGGGRSKVGMGEEWEMVKKDREKKSSPNINKLVPNYTSHYTMDPKRKWEREGVGMKGGGGGEVGRGGERERWSRKVGRESSSPSINKLMPNNTSWILQ